MALPTLVMPESLPPWLATGYESSPGTVCGYASMSVGHSRTRRIFTRAERREKCLLRLASAQLPVFFNFFEVDLQAGALPFAAKVTHLGPGTRWWDALASYESSTPQSGGFTTIECVLILRGLPQVAGPA